MIRCFTWVPRIENRSARRVMMVLVSPLVLVEYIVNAPISFAYDFINVWKL